jgi:hypothetical protein
VLLGPNISRQFLTFLKKKLGAKSTLKKKTSKKKKPSPKKKTITLSQ